MSLEQCTYTLNGRDYKVSTDGKIIRMPHQFRPTERLLKPTKTAHGYMRLCLPKKHKFVHQIVFEAFNGPIPEGMDIDHINGIRDDNRLSNLRAASRKTNALNRKLANVNSRTGIRGVHLNNKSSKWVFAVSGKELYSDSDFLKVEGYAKQFHGEA